jgi:hypothetical protein
MVTTTRGNGRRTRAGTKKELAALEAGMAAAEPEDEKTKAAKRGRKAKVEKDVADVTIDKIASETAKANVAITKSLAAVTEAAQEEVERLQVVREAVLLKAQDLEELHGKDIVACSIDDLVAQHSEKMEVLNKEIEETRAAWEKEDAEHEEARVERNKSLEKSRKQEADDYNYKLKIQRRNEEDQYDQTVRDKVRAQKDKDETLQASWDAKQRDLEEFEKRLGQQHQELDQRDKEIESKIEQAVKSAESKLHAQYGSEKKYSKLENENAVNLLKQQIANQTTQLESNDQTIEALKQEVTSLQTKLSELATRSLEIGSGKDVAAAQERMAEKMGKK